LVVIVTEPVAAPSAAGVKTMLMVQVLLLVSVAPQLPPPVVGLENGAVTTMARLRVAPVALRTVRVCDALGLPCATFPKARLAGVTAMLALVPVRATGVPVTVAPVYATVNVLL
jgi:hypothetical protein